MYRILMVEDDSDIQELVANYFHMKEKGAFEVDIADNGQTGLEKAYENHYDCLLRDIMLPESYMYLAREIMCCGHDVPEKYLATAHGDFRNAPEAHFYYGSAEALYAFAPSYAESFRKAGVPCTIHVGKGMHHCYAIQYFIPGCQKAFEEIMSLIASH